MHWIFINIYFDNVVLSAVSKDEIRNHLINSIATMPKSLPDNYEFWDDDTLYNTTITWESNNNTAAIISAGIKNSFYGTILLITINHKLLKAQH